MNQRLNRLENAIKKGATNSFQNNNNLIAEFLPLTTVELIKQFESLLKTTQEAATQFVSIVYIYYFLTIVFYLKINLLCECIFLYRKNLC